MPCIYVKRILLLQNLQLLLIQGTFPYHSFWSLSESESVEKACALELDVPGFLYELCPTILTLPAALSSSLTSFIQHLVYSTNHINFFIYTSLNSNSKYTGQVLSSLFHGSQNCQLIALGLSWGPASKASPLSQYFLLQPQFHNLSKVSHGAMNGTKRTQSQIWPQLMFLLTMLIYKAGWWRHKMRWCVYSTASSSLAWGLTLTCVWLHFKKLHVASKSFL